MSPSSTEPSHSPVSDDTLGELRGFVVPEVVSKFIIFFISTIYN